jgi:hypothetical protein
MKTVVVPRSLLNFTIRFRYDHSWFWLERVVQVPFINPQTSVNLLDSLESFLSTFQKDLSAVSGQISELQDRSKDIDNRLRGRRVRSIHLSSRFVS